MPGHEFSLPRRRSLLACGVGLLGAGFLHAAVAAPPDKNLPPSRSLSDELAAALALGQPLVVMISLHGCPWCRLVRRNYLAPMHDADGLPVVQLDWRSKDLTRAFDGAPTTHDELIRAWGISMAPTVLFFGPGGKEMARRLEGVSENFYSAQLDSRLRQARSKLKGAGVRGSAAGHAAASIAD